MDEDPRFEGQRLDIEDANIERLKIHGYDIPALIVAERKRASSGR